MKDYKELKGMFFDVHKWALQQKDKEKYFFQCVAETYFDKKGKQYVYNDDYGSFFPAIAIINDVVADTTIEEIDLEQKFLEDNSVEYIPIIKVLDLGSGETYNLNIDDLRDISYLDLASLLLSELK